MGDFYITWGILHNMGDFTYMGDGGFLHNMGDFTYMGDFYITWGILYIT